MMSNAMRMVAEVVGLLFAVQSEAAPEEPPLKITTVAGTGQGKLGTFSGPAAEVDIDQPFGLEIGPDGLLYICEIGNHRVLKLDPQSRRVETVAGNGKKGSGGEGGPAKDASLNEPYEVRLDAAGNLYFLEMVGAVVRRVDGKSGTIRTVAGTGEPGFGGDGGPATRAAFRQPHSIALDGQGGLYVADIGNHRVRRVDLSAGTIETIAGNGERRMPSEGAVATGQPLFGPRALCVAEGALWIALREGNSVWRMDLQTRLLSRVAGTSGAGYRDGPAGEAAFDGPKGIAFGPGNDLFVADTENEAIRRIDLKARLVSTVAGSGPKGRGYGGDGGPPLEAKLDRPHGIAVDRTGVLYIGDSNNHRVRRVGP